MKTSTGRRKCARNRSAASTPNCADTRCSTRGVFDRSEACAFRTGVPDKVLRLHHANPRTYPSWQEPSPRAGGWVF